MQSIGPSVWSLNSLPHWTIRTNFHQQHLTFDIFLIGQRIATFYFVIGLVVAISTSQSGKIKKITISFVSFSCPKVKVSKFGVFSILTKTLLFISLKIPQNAGASSTGWLIKSIMVAGGCGEFNNSIWAKSNKKGGSPQELIAKKYQKLVILLSFPFSLNPNIPTDTCIDKGKRSFVTTPTRGIPHITV